ncbi:gustatory receptor [Homalodisca vitripennis]|nr:gustatory receptor [Homalodisca vitripennis]
MQVLSKEVILTSHVFGGFCLTNCSVKNDGQELRFSPSWFTWSLISTAAQATLPCYWVYLQYLNTQSILPSYWNTNTTTTVMILEHTCLSLTSVVVFVSNIRKYQCFINFHKRVENIEDTWKGIGDQPPESKINIRILVAFVVTAALITYDIATWGISTINKYENGVTITVCYVSYLTTIFRLTSTFVTFTEVTQYLSKSFKYISIRIERELARQCFGRLMENQYMPYIEISQQSTNSQKCEVESLMDIYWLLVDAVHEANAFYCILLMATTSYLFFSIVFYLYYSVLNFYSGDYLELIWTFIWAFASISYLVVMVRSAADVTKSAEKTTMAICKTIHKGIEPAMRTQLEKFLLQVSNDRPTFCALHLFKIKSDILNKVAGAVTTYLVILLQFQNQNEEI